ncbi:MAG: hypothetical protein Q9164_004918, partial [Protoblastenia rupestris]
LDDVQGLLSEIDANGQALCRGRDAARTTLIAKARSLIAALETPVETITWIAWAEVGKTHLAETAGPVFQRLPTFFAETQYASPSDNTAGPFQFGQDTKLTVWQWRSERPQLEQAFNNHMAGYSQGRPSWMDEGFYPVNDRLVQGMKPGKEEVAIVDVGGNVGYDLQELIRKYPNLPGRLVLQDRPDVIAKVVDTGEGIEATSYDFFTEQPVKGMSLFPQAPHLPQCLLILGARAYYMHSILHDWPNPDCGRILHQIAGAMEKGYSKLLINENIVPDLGADWKITSLDWFMMALAASAERTETEWIELLRSAGLKVVGIWTMDSAVESLIEAVLEEDDRKVA